MFDLRVTVHTTIQYTPAQLDFGYNLILNWCHDVDLKTIRKQKEDFVNKVNKFENCNWINHIYKQEDKILLKNAWKTKCIEDIYLGPYVIIVARNDGTIMARKIMVIDTFNILNLTCYKE